MLGTGPRVKERGQRKRPYVSTSEARFYRVQSVDKGTLTDEFSLVRCPDVTKNINLVEVEPLRSESEISKSSEGRIEPGGSFEASES